MESLLLPFREIFQKISYANTRITPNKVKLNIAASNSYYIPGYHLLQEYE